MRLIKLIIKFIISLPKTVLFNFKIFPFKIALKLPILLAYNVKISNIHKNCIVINSNISSFMIKINYSNGSDGVNETLKKKGFFDIKKNGRLIFNGKANFASGVSIRVDNGNLVFGKNFSCNKNCFFSNSEGICIGDNVLLGWNVSIRDSDGHAVYSLDDHGVERKVSKSVTIGNHVWLCANVDVLKGVEIADDCIVGYNSCVTKKFINKNCLIAGYPAKVVKNNVNWES